MRFSIVDVSSPDNLQGYLKSLDLVSREEPVVIFTRFFLHSLSDSELNAFVIGLSSGLEKPIVMVHEFRTPEDSEMPKAFSNHSRVFRTPDTVLEAFSQHFDITEATVSQEPNRAVYKEDDARVAWVRFSSMARLN